MSQAPIGVSFSLEQVGNTNEVVELTRAAEDLGFDSVWIPEAWGRDAFTLLAVLATQTSRIHLATGIVNVFSRTPAIVAQSIASLDELSEGRAILGLGASGPRVIERWHGLKFERVLQRTREFVEVVRLILSGDRADFQGEIYRVRDFALAFRPPRPHVPIFLAAIGPANVRLTGEIADGWLPVFASQNMLDAANLWLDDGAARSGRTRADIVVASYIPALIGPHSATPLRRHIAFYVGGMGSFYYRLMVRSGWEEQANAIRLAWRSGRCREAADLVSSEMLDALAVTGGMVDARDRLMRFRELGVDVPILAIPHGADVQSIHATLEALGG